MSCHHQVAVRGEVLNIGGLVADRGHLTLHPGDLEHAAWVVFQQVALKGLPASTNTHHHMLVVQHLQGDKAQETTSENEEYSGTCQCKRVPVLVIELFHLCRANVLSLIKALKPRQRLNSEAWL